MMLTIRQDGSQKKRQFSCALRTRGKFIIIFIIAVEKMRSYFFLFFLLLCFSITFPLLLLAKGVWKTFSDKRGQQHFKTNVENINCLFSTSNSKCCYPLLPEKTSIYIYLQFCIRRKISSCKCFETSRPQIKSAWCQLGIYLWKTKLVSRGSR